MKLELEHLYNIDENLNITLLSHKHRRVRDNKGLAQSKLVWCV